MITTSLERSLQTLSPSVTRHLPMDILQAVLPYIAFHIFDQQKKSLQYEELEDIVRQYQENHQVRFSTDNLIQILESAHILQKDFEGCYRFKYSYVGSHFVASYIASSLDLSAHKDRMRELLKEMTERLHVEEYSKILMLFMYFRRDEETIRDILMLAKNLFAEHKPCNLLSDVSFVNDLSGKTLPVLLDDNNISQHKDEHRRELDNAERDNFQEDDDDEAAKWREWEEKSRAEREKEESEMREAQDQALSMAQQFNLAAKTGQLMGQILRNFPGVLEGEPKLEIAVECELLGLRALQALYVLIETHLEDFRAYFSSILLLSQDKEPETDEENQIWARHTDDFMAQMLMQTAYVYVRRIAHSVGSEHLRETYKAISDEPSPIAIGLIHTSVKLDHFREFPKDDILRLDKAVADNFFARWVLRRMVRDHFYLFPVPFDLKQSMCERLDIKTHAPRTLPFGEKRPA